MAKSYQWEILSVARFLLAFMVLVDHLEVFSKIGLLHWYASGTFEAILGFLLISGFSIGKSIQKNQESYFKRRVERIYPVYLASILLVYLVTPPQFSVGLIVILIINLFFLNQVIINASLVGPAWSLALEVWLYALAPLLLKASYKLLFYIIIISFACFCFYTVGRTKFHWPYYSGTKYGVNIILLSFIWIAGFALATQKANFKLFARCILSVFVLHILLKATIQFLYRWKHDQFNEFLTTDSIIIIISALCLFGVYYAVVLNDRIPVPGDRTKKIFHFLGNISYPLYLSHFTAFVELKKFNVTNPFLMIMFALFTAFIIYYVFDFYSKRRPVAGVRVTSGKS